MWCYHPKKSNWCASSHFLTFSPSGNLIQSEAQQGYIPIYQNSYKASSNRVHWKITTEKSSKSKLFFNLAPEELAYHSNQVLFVKHPSVDSVRS